MHRGVARAVNAFVSLLPLPVSRALRFRLACGFWPSLDDPRGFHEKVHWRILRDRRELWDWTCDKLAMKDQVARLSPTTLIPKVLWRGTTLDDPALDALPHQWILKSNNSSGQIVIGSGAIDRDAVRGVIATWDTRRQWRLLGESAYREAHAGMFVEEWIGDAEQPPADYKFFVFDGVAHFVHAHTERYLDHRGSIYTADWVRIPAVLGGVADHSVDLPRPHRLAEMVAAAETIGAGFDFIRVDLFETTAGVWFGETSPYPWSGLNQFVPASFEREAGDFWRLPTVGKSGL